MEIFIEKFNVRWSDVDANRHVGNSSYMNYCSQTRMSFLNSRGFGINHLVKWGVIPVILKEEFIFYRELHVDQTVYVTLELTAISEDGNIFEFTHKIYDSEGIHHSTSYAKGVWIDMIQRKRITPPEELKEALLAVTDKNNLKIVTMDDIKDKEKPVSLDPDFLKNNSYIH
ncbi:MAG: thioesterase family protein [Flavobacteriaceae bacterium]|jgi:acyl-CoA thioester hydrolase|nr:thioesterase family protein [Flavobacteriaceae bacterium]